jgi:hypothetical protein
MRILLQVTALALAAGTALASFPMKVGYGIMPRASGNLQVCIAFLFCVLYAICHFVMQLT